MVQSKSNPIYRKILLFVICILVSGFLWLLNILNIDQTKVINFDVRFTGIPNQYALIYPLPSNLNFEIQSTGYHFLINDIQYEKKEIEIPLSIPSNIIDKKSSTIIYLDDYKSKIQSQLNHHYQLVDILLDTIRIGFDEKWEKKVPIIYNKDISFKKGYQISSDIIIQPNEILIYGSKSLLDNIHYVSTEKKSHSNISANIEETYSLIPIPNVSYSVNKVNVTIPVEQYTEKEISVNIIKVNEPQNKKLQIVPKKVNLKILVSLSQYNSISENDFKIIANYPNGNTQLKKLIPEVISKPEYVFIQEISPKTVEYIITESK